MKRRVLLLLLIVGWVAFPERASANAGTPLMWAGMLHLVVGNALIGLLEGSILVWLFHLSRAKTITTMIAANYVSAWIGGLFIRGAIVESLPIDLNNAWRWFWIMVVVTYGITLLLEWPFIAWCFRGTQLWARRSIQASFVVQSVSYAILFGWYWVASGTSLYTKMNVVSPAELSLPRSVLVYFIAPADGNVYKCHLAGGDEQKVFDLHSTNANDRLLVKPSTVNIDRWDLVARLENKGQGDPRFVDVLTNMSVEAAPDWRSTHTDPPQYEGTWFNCGKVENLGSAANSQWEFWTGFWPIEGMRASNKATGEQVRFSYETPFGAWTARNAVNLPSDNTLFQFGNDQICAFDPVRRRVALLWRGRGPVPVIERNNGN